MNLPTIIRIYLNNQLVHIKQFSQDQIIIGNHPDVHIQLDDVSIAHFHATIEKRENQFFLMDLGSKTGTYVEDEKIIKKKIESGTVFRIGKYKIEFFIGTPKPISSVQSKSLKPETQSESKNQQGELKNKIESDNPSKIVEKPTPQTKPIQKDDFLSSKDVDENQPSQNKNAISLQPPMANETDLPTVIEDKIYYKTVSEKKNLSAQETGDEEKDQKINFDSENFSASIHPITHSSKTFAPPSAFQDLNEVIKPGKGSSIEVLIAWKERILNTYYLNKKSKITIGANKNCDIKIPLLNVSKTYHKLIQFSDTTTVYFTKEMTGSFVKKNQEKATLHELIQTKKVKKTFFGYKLKLNQEEMARIDLQNGLISIYIRYTAKTPKPPLGSFLNFNSIEFTGFLLAIILSILMGFYLSVYTNVNPVKDKKEEPLRKVFIQITKRKPPPPPPPLIQKKDPLLTPKKKIERPSVALKKKKVIKPKPRIKQPTQRKKIALKKKIIKPRPSIKQPTQRKKMALKKKPIPPSRRSSISRTKIKPKKLKIASELKTKNPPRKKITSTTKNKIKNPTKVGILSVLGSKGNQSKLSKIYSGSGEIEKNIKSNSQKTTLPGVATDFLSNSFNPNQGNNKEKNTGTISISKVKGKVRRNRNYDYGETQFGKKATTRLVNFQGRGAKFSGFMNKEAIRKVIQRNKGAIKSCYNIALNKSPNLYGSIVLSWYIEPNGSVSGAKVVSSTIGNPRMKRCILTHLKSWIFPRPPKGQIGKVAQYPLVFKALK